MLKHHWIEEAPHARLDGLVLLLLAHRSSAKSIAAAIEEYLEIGAFLEGGLTQQAQFDLRSLERAPRKRRFDARARMMR